MPVSKVPDTMHAALTYSVETGEAICERLAEGESLSSICRSLNLRESTVRGWVTQAIEPFAANYARAREIADDLKFDRLEDMASEEPPRVKGFTDAGWVQWKKNQLDQFKWNLMRNRPKKYGDKLALEHSVDESLAARLDKARTAAPVTE